MLADTVEVGEQVVHGAFAIHGRHPTLVTQNDLGSRQVDGVQDAQPRMKMPQ